MTKILMISNMYPSNKNPHYGIFVKNTFELINSPEDISVKMIGMSLENNRIRKLISYIIWSIKCIVYGIFGNYQCIYGHYISHVSFVIRIIKKCKKDMIVILNAHGEDVLAEEKKYEKNMVRSEKVLPKAQMVVVPSKYYQEVVHNNFQVPLERIFVYPSGGIDRSIFYPRNTSKCRNELQIEDRYTIGFVARIEAAKGWREFLEAIGKLRTIYNDFNVVIVGSGSDEEKMKLEIKNKSLGDICFCYSSLPHDRLSVVYGAMDLFVGASSRYSESLGLVGLEAMAAGCECVLSSAPGQLTYAKDDWNAHIFEMKNVEMLYEKIVKARKQPEEKRKFMIQNAIETINEYDREVTMKNLLAKICESVSGDSCNYGEVINE